MARYPLRRAQLIAPFGVGAMTTFSDGASLMVAGLDHWYDPPGRLVDLDEFIVEEWRLERRLGLDHLRLPPDHRRGGGSEGDVANVGMTIPAVRFPEMHVCQRCNRLTRVAATERGRLSCPPCQRDGQRSSLTQVQFLAMCAGGHVRDFPFSEWVHRTLEPICPGPIKLYGTSGSSLVSVFVECGCGRRRNLAGVTEAIGDDRTVLSHQLAGGDGDATTLRCSGSRPWLGRRDEEGCDLPLRGGLRSASNTYFASTVASVYVPREQTGVPPDVVAQLDVPPVSTWIRILREAGVEPSAAQLRGKFPGLVPDGVTDDALDSMMSDDEPAQPADDDGTEESFRQLEHDAMSAPRTDTQLTVRMQGTGSYEAWFSDAFEPVSLVERLRVTRAFTGFERLRSGQGGGADELERRMRMLWRHPPDRDERWLPASVTYGEGILLRLRPEPLREWEQRPEVGIRAARLQRRYDQAAAARGAPTRDISARTVLLHTVSHLLISELAFHAGYSAASLGERLYVSEARDMAGLLIYTAAGDAEGTLGGLVRLGRAGHLEALLKRAVERAGWCSSDPICHELGESGGQGPDSCNLAACHDCAILPETSCEEFNRFLDRTLVADAAIGYLAALSR